MTMRRSMVASVAGRYIGMVVQLAGSLIMARLLTPSEFGLFGIAVAVVWIASVLREFGVSNYLIQLPVLDRASIGRAIGLVATASILLALALLLARDWISEFYREPRLPDLITLSVVGFLLSPFGIGAYAALQRELMFVTLNLIQLASSMLGAAVGIVLAWHGHGAISLVWVQLISSAASILLMALVRPRETFCLPRFGGWRNMLGFGFFATLAGLALQFHSIAINLVLGRGLGVASVGLFDRASGTLQYLTRDLLGAILQVVYVGLAQTKANDSHLSWFAQLALTHVIAVLWPAFAVVAALAEPLVLVLFGEQWHQVVPLVQVLSLSAAIATFTTIHARTLLAKGRTAQLCVMEWSLLIFRIAVIAVGIKLYWSLLVVAWIQVFVAAVTMAAYLPIAHRHVLIPFRALIGIALQGAAISLATALPAFVLDRYLGPSMGHLPMLALAGAAAGASWLAVVYILRHPIAGELTKATRKLWANVVG